MTWAAQNSGVGKQMNKNVRRHEKKKVPPHAASSPSTSPTSPPLCFCTEQRARHRKPSTHLAALQQAGTPLRSTCSSFKRGRGKLEDESRAGRAGDLRPRDCLALLALYKGGEYPRERSAHAFPLQLEIGHSVHWQFFLSFACFLSFLSFLFFFFFFFISTVLAAVRAPC